MRSRSSSSEKRISIVPPRSRRTSADLRREAIAQPVDDARRLGIERRRGGVRGFAAGSRASASSARTLRPSAAARCATRVATVFGNREQRARRARAERAFAYERLDRIGKTQQPHGICDRGAAASDALRDLLLRETVRFHQVREAHRFFERIEVFALQVLDDRDFERFAIVGVAHERRNRREPRRDGRAPTPFARDQFVAVAR